MLWLKQNEKIQRISFYIQGNANFIVAQHWIYIETWKLLKAMVFKSLRPLRLFLYFYKDHKGMFERKSFLFWERDSRIFSWFFSSCSVYILYFCVISAIELNEEIYRINDSRWVLPYLEPIFPLEKGHGCYDFLIENHFPQKKNVRQKINS